MPLAPSMINEMVTSNANYSQTANQLNASTNGNENKLIKPNNENLTNGNSEHKTYSANNNITENNLPKPTSNGTIKKIPRSILPIKKSNTIQIPELKPLIPDNVFLRPPIHPPSRISHSSSRPQTPQKHILKSTSAGDYLQFPSSTSARSISEYQNIPTTVLNFNKPSYDSPVRLRSPSPYYSDGTTLRIRSQSPLLRGALSHPGPSVQLPGSNVVIHRSPTPVRSHHIPPRHQGLSLPMSSLSRSPSPVSCVSSIRSGPSSIYESCSSMGYSFSANKTKQILNPDRSKSPTPRRTFPQQSNDDLSLDVDEFNSMEQSPVVFDANLTFVLGCKNQKVRQNFRPTAAHMDSATGSNYLSAKIDDFLRRTDHVMDEWRGLGRKDDDTMSMLDGMPANSRLGRSKSATNIRIKGFQYYSRASSARSPSITRDISRDISEDRTISDAGELSEMTADLAEEHSTAMMASERLDAETAERVRLERDLLETQMKNKSLQQTSERLEMELLYARSDLNGVHSDSEDANSEHGDSGGVYKQRYERVSRELEFTRRRLQQQHEDDLEQLVGLKKQLEKKLADAYEEVEEQRQVVGQWKRKVQKLNGEMNDLRLLLEEQNSRNNILEKKQRKFDSETQMMHDDIRQEKQAKERIGREKDVLIAEKFTLEQNLADTRLELELKDERLINLQQELDEFTFGGKTEEEVAQLKKIKHELDNKCRDQEEELDDLAGQVQILEQAKLRLEMSLENLRKESRREAQQRDDEIEEVRGNAQKKVKALESQLESEHEERTLLLREKHELERRLTSAEEALRSDHQVDVEVVQRLKRDLKRTKALLRDAQTMLERNKADSPGKAVMRQLRNQLEDSECARLTAVKAKQTLEGEVAELQASLDEGNRLRSDAEDRAGQAHRERAELRGQLEENEEELAEVLKKYRSTVQQLSLEQLSVTEQATRVSELESEKSALKETVAELSARLEAMETLGDPNTSLQQIRLESRVKELESKLELEQTTRSRLEVQMSRHKEALERSTSEATASRSKEQLAQDSVRKLQRNLRELRDEFHTLAARETECIQRRKELEKRLEVSEAENSSARADLRLALQRIEDLQTAMQGEISGSENSDSEHDSYSSDESIDTFLANHKVSPNKSAQPTPSSHDASPRISVKKENSVSISSDQDPNTSFA